MAPKKGSKSKAAAVPEKHGYEFGGPYDDTPQSHQLKRALTSLIV